MIRGKMVGLVGPLIVRLACRSVTDSTKIPRHNTTAEELHGLRYGITWAAHLIDTLAFMMGDELTEDNWEAWLTQLRDSRIRLDNSLSRLAVDPF